MLLARWQATLEQLKGSLGSREINLAVWLLLVWILKAWHFSFRLLRVCKKEKRVGENEKKNVVQRSGTIYILTSFFFFPLLPLPFVFPHLPSLPPLAQPLSLPCSYKWVRTKKRGLFLSNLSQLYPSKFLVPFPPLWPLWIEDKLLLLGGAKF